MFNKKMKQFEKHWIESVQDLHKEALGLLEWYLSQEEHVHSQVNSGDIQTRYNELDGSLNVFRNQLLVMPDYLKAYAKVDEVNNVLQELKDFMDNPRDIPAQAEQQNFTDSIIEDLFINDSLSGIDLAKIMHLPYEVFITQIQALPVQAKHYAYTAVARQFFLETQNMKIYNFKYLAELADDTHNLPAFIFRDMTGFDDSYFWKSIYRPGSRTKHFLIKTFITGLWGYYRWKQRTENENYVSSQPAHFNTNSEPAPVDNTRNVF
jgi:hypothetical protein